MEYPGYGIYEGTPNATKISEDSEIVYDYLTKELMIPEDRIIIFGRSIGSGPASYLAARRKVRALILMSPYTSIRNVVKTHVGRLLQYLVADRFNNIEEIQKVNCPVFLIHGKKDTLIPFENSKMLYEKAKDKSDYWYPNYMTHNNFDMLTDLIIPIHNFLMKNEISINNSPEKFIKIETKDFTQIFIAEKKTFFEKFLK